MALFIPPPPIASGFEFFSHYDGFPLVLLNIDQYLHFYC